MRGSESAMILMDENWEQSQGDLRTGRILAVAGRLQTRPQLEFLQFRRFEDLHAVLALQ
jgi:hypothetical protein